MLAYLFWHHPYDTVNAREYEDALLHFQEQLSKESPSGFRGCASFHVAGLPWLGSGRRGYEDWCLVEGSWALDPLNAMAVARPVVGAHDSAAAQMEEGHGGLYTLVWGESILPDRSTALWLTRPRGILWRPVLDALRQRHAKATLWRRLMVLGPGAEFALVSAVPSIAVPSGWTALSVERVRVGRKISCP
jgi:hypothetical protein